MFGLGRKLQGISLISCFLASLSTLTGEVSLDQARAWLEEMKPLIKRDAEAADEIHERFLEAPEVVQKGYLTYLEGEFDQVKNSTWIISGGFPLRVGGAMSLPS